MASSSPPPVVPTTKGCRPIPMDEGPCYEQTDAWRDCVDKHLKDKNMKSECEGQRHLYDRCVSTWREKVGPDVKIKGARVGEPPPQCQGLACLVEKCLVKTTYNYNICNGVVQQFKHCTKGLYGSEYVID